MKYIICFFIFSLSIQAKEIIMLTDLSPLKWENRIILVNTINNKDSILNNNKDSILKRFEQHTAEINERDIVWFVMRNGTVATNFNGDIADDFVTNTNQKYKVKYTINQEKVILIGKDGAIKSSRKNLELAEIFSEIDMMPMRKIEMLSQ